jgi:hypothetical protein
MDRLLVWYFALPHDNKLGIVTKVINRSAAKALKIFLDITVPESFKATKHELEEVLNTTPRKTKVIVSLTSFSVRLDDVWIVIECLYRQTYKVDRIVLWLDKGVQYEELPKSLKQQIERGLEVRFVEDLRAHTKYYYALQEFKKDIVITVDDDCYYPLDTIANLIDINKEFPRSIAANRIHGIVFDKKNKIVPYSDWKHNFKPQKNDPNLHLLTGVSGVLYPPEIFNETLFEKEVLLDICKYADDIWISMHAILNEVQIKTNTKFNKDFISISKSSRVRLLNHNSKNGGNDDQLKSVLKHLQMDPLIKFVNNKQNI